MDDLYRGAAILMAAAIARWMFAHDGRRPAPPRSGPASVSGDYWTRPTRVPPPWWAVGAVLFVAYSIVYFVAP